MAANITAAQVYERCKMRDYAAADWISEIEDAINDAVARERCAEIVRKTQIAYASDACGWALDRIKDGLPADFIRQTR